MVRTFFRGLSTGFLLQLAVGPVFFFVLNTAVKGSCLSGLAAVAGVTVADYFYIALAALGVGKLLERRSVRNVMAVLSSAVLILFGGVMLAGVFRTLLASDAVVKLPEGAVEGKEFLSALLLTLSSPLTIVFWTGLFTAKALEYRLDKGSLLLFGMAAGLATPLFLGSAVLVLSAVRGYIPPVAVSVVNGVVGLLLVGYGLVRLVKALVSLPKKGDNQTKEDCLDPA